MGMVWIWTWESWQADALPLSHRFPLNSTARPFSEHWAIAGQALLKAQDCESHPPLIWKFCPDQAALWFGGFSFLGLLRKVLLVILNFLKACSHMHMIMGCYGNQVCINQNILSRVRVLTLDLLLHVDEISISAMPKGSSSFDHSAHCAFLSLMPGTCTRCSLYSCKSQPQITTIIKSVLFCFKQTHTMK